ncbi:MAG TPA: peptide-methionine (R)-S-oxide reductase MsrB [bacterium]|nr:peptide-methionine (R)-S-oxide reductase MsrB [bacterium]
MGNKTVRFLAALALCSGLAGLPAAKESKTTQGSCYMGKYKGDKVVKTDAEWKKILTPGAFEILRHEDTEQAFSGAYWDNHEKGLYVCAGCGLELFSSADKFDSGTGWPSFTRPLFAENVASRTDSSLGMDRTEVHCPRCGGHLGHVFDDGPAPTGLRYCINSASIRFVPEKK